MPVCGYCKKFRGKISDLSAHLRTCKVDPRWEKVLEARKAGHPDAANRIVRKILGISKPMTEEAKEKLRAWQEAHKDEIRVRQKNKRRVRSAIKKGIALVSRRLKR